MPPVPPSPGSPPPRRVVSVPAAVEAGTGRLEARLAHGEVVADLDVTVCHACRRGVIEHVRTDPPHRRRGHGRALVNAALCHGDGYAWTTTAVDTTGAAAFWHAVAPDLPHQPVYCTHMRHAATLEP